MIRLKRNNLSKEAQDLIKESLKRKETIMCPPVLAKGSEASIGLITTVKEAKIKFKGGGHDRLP